MKFLIGVGKDVIFKSTYDDLYDSLLLVTATEKQTMEIIEWAGKAEDGDEYVCSDCKVIAVCEVE